MLSDQNIKFIEFVTILPIGSLSLVALYITLIKALRLSGTGDTQFSLVLLAGADLAIIALAVLHNFGDKSSFWLPVALFTYTQCLCQLFWQLSVRYWILSWRLTLTHCYQDPQKYNKRFMALFLTGVAINLLAPLTIIVKFGAWQLFITINVLVLLSICFVCDSLRRIRTWLLQV